MAVANPTSRRVPAPLDGVTSDLTTIRQRLKEELERKKLFGQQLFDVWINEDAPALDGSDDSWAGTVK